MAGQLKGQQVFTRVSTFIDQGDYKQARRLLDSCEKKKYCADTVSYFRALSNLRSGELRLARKSWKKHQKTFPSYGENYFLKGLIDFSETSYASSVDAFTRFLELNPANEKALYNRALAFGMLDDYDSAIRDLDTLIKKGSVNPAVFYSRAYWCEYLQKYDEAAAGYSRVVQLEPRNFDAYLGLAYAYRNLGEGDKACEAISRAIAQGSQIAAELRENYCR
jgi:tetratricopeptide (TPR) repeat protein